MTVYWVSTRPFPHADERVEARATLPRSIADEVNRIIVDLDAPVPGLTKESLQNLVHSGRHVAVLLPGRGATGTPITASDLLGLDVSLITEPEFGLPSDRQEEPSGIEAGPPSTDVDFDTLLTTPASRSYISELNAFLRIARRVTAMPRWKWRNDSTESDAPSLRQLLRVKGSNRLLSNMEYFAASSATPDHQWDPEGRQHAHPPALLLLGESGTGKTLSARIAHQHLYPADHRLRPFITVNAPVLEGGRNFEASFYGATDAMFTDTEELVGPALQASGGTLFIDEIADLSTTAQAALLDFLNSRLARVQGLDSPVFVPVQIIAATNNNFEELSSSNGFRTDLLNRFGFTLRIAPLRERLAADPGELSVFLRRWLADPGMNPPSPLSGEPAVRMIEAGAVADLASRPYRVGNVRELQAVVRRSILTASAAGDDVVWVADVPRPTDWSSATEAHPAPAIKDGLPRSYSQSRFRLWRFGVPTDKVGQISAWAQARFELADTPDAVEIHERYFDTMNGSLMRSGYRLLLRTYVATTNRALVLQSALTAEEDPQADYESQEVRIGSEAEAAIIAEPASIPEILATGGFGGAMTAGLLNGLARGQHLVQTLVLQHSRTTFAVRDSHLVSIMKSELMAVDRRRDVGIFVTLLHRIDPAGGPILEELQAFCREGWLIGDGRSFHAIARAMTLSM